MIRIELRRRPRRAARWLAWAGAAVLLGVSLGWFWQADGLSRWRDGRRARPAAPGRTVAPAPLSATPARPDTATSPGIPVLPDSAAQPPEPPDEGQTVLECGCEGPVAVLERLPPGMRVVALACRSSGEYCIEGRSASRPALEALLDSLHRLPSEVGLSWWRADSGAAAPGGELCFAYKGRVGAGRVRPVEAISAQRAEQLGAALARWAAAAALSEVRTGSEPVTGVQGGCCRWRRTLWATGTYAQVEEFLGRLAQARPVAAVQELVFGPAAAAAPGAPLYCVVDFFVSRTARP